MGSCGLIVTREEVDPQGALEASEGAKRDS